MLFSPAGHVQAGHRQGAGRTQAWHTQPGPAPVQELPRAVGAALFMNVGKRLLEIRAAGLAFLAPASCLSACLSALHP